LPFGSPSACAADQPTCTTGEPSLQLALAARSLRRCPPANLRLSPSINLPALPRGPTFDLHRLLRPSALPSSQRPARAFDRPSSPACDPASNSHRLPYRPALRSSQPATCAACQPFRPALGPTRGLRRRSIFQLFRPTQPPTFIGCCISGSAFRSSCDLRRRSTFQPHRQTHLQLSPSINPPDLPSSLLPTCVFRLAFQPHLELNLRLLGCCILRRCPPVNLQLAPLADLLALPADPTSGSPVVASPASPSSRSSTCVSDQPSGHLPIQPSACASIESSGPYLFNPSACASDQTLGRLPIDLPLSLGIDLPAPPSDQPFSFRFSSTFRLMPSNSTSD